MGGLKESCPIGLVEPERNLDFLARAIQSHNICEFNKNNSNNILKTLKPF
jgi:hypothetical protein